MLGRLAALAAGPWVRPLAAGVAVLLAWLGLLGARRGCSPPPPAVKLEVDVARSSALALATSEHREPERKRAVTRTRTTRPDGTIREVVRTVVVDKGAVDRDTSATSATSEHLHETLAVTPAPAAPRWSIAVGIEDPFTARNLRVGLGVRALGPIWLDAAITPSSRTLYVGARMEF